MHRRTMLSYTGALLAATALSACVKAGTASTAATVSIPVTLAGAQSEAQAILTALQAVATGVGAELTSSASSALASAETAVGEFVAITSSTTPTQYASATVTAIKTVVSLLPIPAITATAIDLGISLIAGLVTGLTSVTVPASAVEPASLSYETAASRVPAPIIIPLPGT